MLLRGVLAVIFVATVAAEEVSKQQGRSHLFECTFPISAATYVINWYKGETSVMNFLSGVEGQEVAFTGDLAGRADVQFVNNRNLEILNLRVSDEGEYYCSVSEIGTGGQSGDGRRDQLVVFVPPSITVSGGPYDVEVGEKMMSTCRADSHPPSNFTWTLPNGDVSHGAVLEITNMTQADIGTYMCMADNGYGVDSEFISISMKERQISGSDVMRATGLPIMLLLIGSLLLPVFLS
ncbi:F11R [Branchiostoma lanceolatum]|uniref:F11R protein n=1 Tax=Branchiostoma lanceolatum TaxID=7740 RepID=A0A8K0EG65_BRALA|nr:F11R [Branchiostoma lanceolatum]